MVEKSDIPNRWDLEEKEFQNYAEDMKFYLKQRISTQLTNSDINKSISLENQFGWHPEFDESGYSRSFACITSDIEINKHNFRSVVPKIIEKAFKEELDNVNYVSQKASGRSARFEVKTVHHSFVIPNSKPSEHEIKECFYVPLTSESHKSTSTWKPPIISKGLVKVEEPDEDFKEMMRKELEKRKKKN